MSRISAKIVNGMDSNSYQLRKAAESVNTVKQYWPKAGNLWVEEKRLPVI